MQNHFLLGRGKLSLLKVIKTERKRTASISVKDSAVLVTDPQTLSIGKVHEIVAKKRSSVNKYSGNKILVNFVSYLRSEGYSFITMTDLFSLLSNKGKGALQRQS
jgi:hypothetical protein